MGRSGVPLTSCNWQSVALMAIVSATKVWDEDPFDNAEFAQITSGSYDVNDINAFERVFLQCLGYDIIVNESTYARTQFLLETLKHKDVCSFVVPQLMPERAAELEEKSTKRQSELLEYLERLEPCSPVSSEKKK